jgi:hypothetical protein
MCSQCESLNELVEFHRHRLEQCQIRMVGLQVGNDYWRIALRQLLTSEQLHAVSASAVETHNARHQRENALGQTAQLFGR